MTGRRKSKRERARPGIVPDGFHDQLALWTMRLLIGTGAYRRVESQGWREQALRPAGLEELIDDPSVKPDAFRALLESRTVALESGGIRREGELFENIERFGDRLDLNRTERELLAFSVMANVDPVLEECLREYWIGSTRQLHTLLGRVLGVEAAEVASALRSTAFLPETGLLRIRKSSERPYRCPLALMEILVDLFMADHADETRMLACFFQPVQPGDLTRQDFAHVEEHLGLLVPYLDMAVDLGLSGVNLLVHGEPGLGKTELAKVLAREVGAELFEVAMEDSDGDALSGRNRIAAYSVCQRLLRKQCRTLVLFDEIEDLFCPSPLWDLLSEPRRPVESKGWMNRLLEENPVPTIWISNSVSQIEPAVLRRFDYVLKMVSPPRDARRAMLERHLDGLAVDAPFREAMAANDRIRPADIERAAKVVRTIGADDSRRTEHLLEQVLEAALSVREACATLPVGHRQELDYDLSLLHTDCDLPGLVGSLRRDGRGTICLYGPSGTGKTAFARHLAGTLGKELVSKRASDLFDKYVGESEKNIAEMFRQARLANAVLLLDEADSFLADRRDATRIWEVSQINEILVQMEHFEGLFLCSTNLIDHLDQAVFRRFDLKIRFDYLEQDSRLRLFEKLAAALGIPLEPAHRRRIEAHLRRLDTLTPGDFAAVRRRARLVDERWTPETLLDALSAECACKPQSTHHIGFC